MSNPIVFTTNKVFLWIEAYDKHIGKNVIFKISDKGNFFTCQARKAEFSEQKIIFYECHVSFSDGEKKYFDSIVLNVGFNSLSLIEYLILPLERQSIFKLYTVLKDVLEMGIKSKTDWIILLSKISYPALNLFIIILLIPFFLHRRFLTRTKVFVISFILTLLMYSLYSSGLSLGKAEIIPWQISPWLPHFILLICSGIYFAYVGKKGIIYSKIIK